MVPNIDFVKHLIKTACVLVTLVLVGFWLYRYILDENSSVVEGRYYFEEEDDIFPVMSLCFKQTFPKFDFKSPSENLTAVDYHNFLIGEHYHPLLREVDYHSVSTNISDFVLLYHVEFRNGTMLETHENVAWKPLYYTFTWISWDRIVKCFGLEITNKDVYYIRLFVKREIFPNLIRNSDGGFAVLFHYPNQLSASFKTVKRQWMERDASTNHYMSFNLKGMDVEIQRHKKRRRNCVKNWKNYDNIITRSHLRRVGCRTPDQITNKSWPICDTKDKMKEARLHLNQLSLRPCREIVSIDYDMGESGDNWNETPVVNGKPWKNWICFVLRILNPRFTVTNQRKEVDLQTLIGYIGGYIGIFTGFAITQIPDYMYLVFLSSKRWILSHQREKRDEVLQI